MSNLEIPFGILAVICFILLFFSLTIKRKERREKKRKEIEKRLFIYYQMQGDYLNGYYTNAFDKEVMYFDKLSTDYSFCAYLFSRFKILNMERNLPELYSTRPCFNFNNTGYWFSPDQKDLRLICIKHAIDMCKEQLEKK